MKILFAVHHFPPTYRGGAEWRAHRTARALLALGHEVGAVCVESIDSGDGQEITFEDDVYDGVPIRRLSLNLSDVPDPVRYGYRNPLIGQCIEELLSSFRPDVLHLIGGYLMSGSTIEAAQAAGVPVVLTLTDFWFLCPRITLVHSDGTLCTTPADPLACALCLRKEHRRYRLPDQLSGAAFGRVLSFIWQRNHDGLLGALRERKEYLLALLNTVDLVISPSHFLKGLFEAQGVSPCRFVYMRQGLDMQNWADAGPKQSDSHIRIGYIGQIAKHKGVDVLVEAFRHVRAGEKQPQLILYGDADRFPRFSGWLRKRVANRKDVIFAGRFEHSQIGRIHAGIDVLVVPSVWYENSPNVILEAFATGTPVVVSRLGGMAELVADGVNGFQFEAGDSRDLARVLQRFVDQPSLSTNLRQSMPSVKTALEEVEDLLRLYAALEVKGLV